MQEPVIPGSLFGGTTVTVKDTDHLSKGTGLVPGDTVYVPHNIQVYIFEVRIVSTRSMQMGLMQNLSVYSTSYTTLKINYCRHYVDSLV